MPAIMPQAAEVMTRAFQTDWRVEGYLFHLPQWGLQYPTASSR